MKSKLTINDLNLCLSIGVTDKEKSVPQNICISIILFFDETLSALTSDMYQDAVCYHKIISRLQEILPKDKYNLIEHLAYRIKKILEEFNIFHSKIIVKKLPKIPGFAGNIEFELNT